MARPQRKKTQRSQKEHRVWITNIAQGGDGVARDDDGRVLFVPGALPGEEVHVVELKSQKRFARTKLLGVLKPSEERVEPPCPYHATCGGCGLQHVLFESQLQLKAQAAWETLMRVSKVEDLPEHIELLAAPALAAWRMRSTVRAKRIRGVMEVGMLERGSHHIVPMDRCLVLVEPLQQAMHAMRSVLDEDADLAGAAFFLELSTSEGQVVVTVENLEGKLTQPQLGGLAKRALAHDVIRGVRVEAIEGLLGVTAGVCTVQAGVAFGKCPDELAREELPAGMFRQAHAELSGELVELVLSQLEGDEHILELFSGCGNFTFALHERGVTRQLAIEGAQEAVEVGARLAEKCGASEAISFVQADLFTQEWQAALGEDTLWPTVLLDPPRAGAREVCEGIVTRQDVSKVVYVSCDPGSLARDVGILSRGGFKVEWVAMADMFPGTPHVESVVTLSRG